MSDPWPPRPPTEPGEPGGAGAPGAPAAPGRPAAESRSTEERRSSNRRALGVAIGVVLIVLAVAALASGRGLPPGSSTFPPIGATPGPAGAAAAATRHDVARALAAQGLLAEDSTRTYRPAEAPGFATAPRIILRAILPDDPDHGLIVIYEFSSPTAATDAAREQADYIASGVGRVQFPTDARFVIRVVGATAVFFTWSPENSRDPRTASIGTALETIGLGIPVPN